MALLGQPKGTTIEGMPRTMYMRVDGLSIDKVQRRAVITVGAYTSKTAADAGEPPKFSLPHMVVDSMEIPVGYRRVESLTEGQPPTFEPVMSERGDQYSRYFGKLRGKDPFAQAYKWLKELPTYEGTEGDE